jgi:hypothetical protein
MNVKKKGKPVTIAAFIHPIEAHLAKTKLASVGIESFLADEHIASMDWHFSNAVGGIKLKVDGSAAERAVRVLGGVHFEEGIGLKEDKGPLCIMCNSPGVHTPGLLSLLASFLPLPYVKRRWECRRCGHRWEAR